MPIPRPVASRPSRGHCAGADCGQITLPTLSSAPDPRRSDDRPSLTNAHSHLYGASSVPTGLIAR